MWFSGRSDDELMVGCNDLSSLFQPPQFYKGNSTSSISNTQGIPLSTLLLSTHSDSSCIPKVPPPSLHCGASLIQVARYRETLNALQFASCSSRNESTAQLHFTTSFFRLLLGWEEKQSGNSAWNISNHTH